MGYLQIHSGTWRAHKKFVTIITMLNRGPGQKNARGIVVRVKASVTNGRRVIERPKGDAEEFFLRDEAGDILKQD